MARDDEQYRMLYANISNSKKLRLISGLPQFKRDCHLVYTWLLAWTDDDGRLRGRPGWVLENIFPYEGFTQVELEMILSTLHDIKLIIWYEADDDRFIQIVNPKHKSRKDRYKASVYPTPPKDAHKQKPIDNQVVSTSQPDSNPKSISLSSSLSISAGVKPIDNQPQPVDNSQSAASFEKPKEEKPEPSPEEIAFEKYLQEEKQKTEEQHLKEIRQIYYKVQELYPRFAIQEFFQKHRKENLGAIKYTLNTLIREHEKGHPVDVPMAWCDAIMKKENINFNAKDSEENNNKFKKDTNPMAEFLNIVGGIGKPMPAVAG